MEQIVSTAFIVSFAVSFAITGIAPIVLLIILGVKRKINAIPLFMGAGAFFVSQVLIRIPILNVLSLTEWFQDFAASQMILYVLILSFTAGLFEESARLGGALLLKKHRTYKDIISFGLGHGLCEVVMLIGLSSIQNIVLAVMLNNGSIYAVLPAETIDLLLNNLAMSTTAQVYLQILERFSAVLFHMFATMLIFIGVIKKKKLVYYLLALAAHTFFNFGLLLIAQYTNMYIMEAAALALGLGGLYFILRQKKIMTETE
jgi:uncharacterized membrane protein YhfC